MNPAPQFHHRSAAPVAIAASPTILVVDDQPALCEIASIFLHRCGYRVLTANSGDEAKTIVRQQSDIDLLLTDVEMPGMPGDELAEWFHAIRPQVPVVFMSGNRMQHQRLRPCRFVDKPFIHLDILLNTIRGALRDSDSGQNPYSAAA
jgi:CheY-like chemotaxis protein